MLKQIYNYLVLCEGKLAALRRNMEASDFKVTESEDPFCCVMSQILESCFTCVAPQFLSSRGYNQVECYKWGYVKTKHPSDDRF